MQPDGSLRERVAAADGSDGDVRDAQKQLFDQPDPKPKGFVETSQLRLWTEAQAREIVEHELIIVIDETTRRAIERGY